MGTGATAYPKIIGRAPREGFPFGRDLAHVKTVGNYWPYATTVYDYLRRAMPLNHFRPCACRRATVLYVMIARTHRRRGEDPR